MPTTDEEKLLVRLEADSRRLLRELDKANKRLARFEDATKKHTSAIEKHFGKLGTGLKSFIALFVVNKIRNFGSELGSLSDEFIDVNNRIRLVTDSTQSFLSAQADLFAVSQDTRQALSATAELYQRLKQSSQQLALTDNQLISVTETINKSLAISGSAAAATRAAIIQLGQGLSAGALRGHEFNSVAEQAPRLLQVLLDSLHKNRGELRKMAEQGELTSELIIAAVASQSHAIDKEFSSIDKKIEEVSTKFHNSMVRLIGDINQATGASKGFNAVIETLGGGLDRLSDSIEGKVSGNIDELRTELTSLAKSIAILEKLPESDIAIQKQLAAERVKFLRTRLALQEKLNKLQEKEAGIQEILTRNKQFKIDLPDAELAKIDRELDAFIKQENNFFKDPLNRFQFRLGISHEDAVQVDRDLRQLWDDEQTFFNNPDNLAMLRLGIDKQQLINLDHELKEFWEEEQAYFNDERNAAALQIGIPPEQLKQIDNELDKLFNEEMGEYIGDAKAQFDQLNTYADQAARNMQDAFADYLFDPFDKGVAGMLEGFTRAIRRMVAEIAAAQILKASGLEGFIGGAVSGLFGGLGKAKTPQTTSFPKLYSADGGGYTGKGARSGGLDGKGGFLSLLHSNEIIIDLDKTNDQELDIDRLMDYATGKSAVNANVKQKPFDINRYLKELDKQAYQPGEIESYEGGGFTGSGARSGGLDGRGGKLGIFHPNEYVFDLEQESATGAQGKIDINFTIQANDTRGFDALLSARRGQIIGMIQDAFIRSGKRGFE